MTEMGYLKPFWSRYEYHINIKLRENDIFCHLCYFCVLFYLIKLGVDCNDDIS